ncbi:MAG: hypothetical protein EOM17_13380, partial [Synergistales bacterium]|nr:hypothetical protein [Synergistales bacterium]
ILNGVHTASTPVALLAGVEYVKDFVEDERFTAMLSSLVHDEIVPAFSDDSDAHKYGDDVLERFRNPALEHAFRSIALNSIAKATHASALHWKTISGFSESCPPCSQVASLP